MINGFAITTSQEMQRVEALAFEAGESGKAYMEKAGSEMAAHIRNIAPDHIYLLLGKGNKAGDGLKCCSLLIQEKIPITAYALYPLTECSPLCQEMAEKFKAAGGSIEQIHKAPTLNRQGIILDALLGTGFSGGVKGLYAEVIQAANTSKIPIVSIDLPSGLDGNTGKVETIAIKAAITFTLGLPKIGLFLEKGWDHVGQLTLLDFGMPKRFLDQAEALAYLISPHGAKEALPPIVRTRHKYQRGYVLAIAGSKNMPGAALMASTATLRAGAGIIRLFYPEDAATEFTAAPFEIIREPWDLKDDTRILEESKRAKALILGPGMGRDTLSQTAIGKILSKTHLPTIVDADALYFLSEHKEHPLPKITILTPHHQEMERILGVAPILSACQKYVDKKGVTVILKGAPTIIFHPHTKPLIVPFGDPGMATAGTGDVLTGVVAALIAQGLEPRTASGLAVLLHGVAGELAAKNKTSYSVIATDLITLLPEAIKALLQVA